ncbi:MAG: hypothetical protein RLZZ35_841, partial [Actinomycetota bacterium]
DWLSTYGALIILKVGLLGFIALTAIKIRKNLADSSLIRFEISLLLLVTAIGSLLSGFTPIVESEFEYDRVKEITGVGMPPEPTWQRLFFEYEADALMLGALVFATALYIRGVVILSRRGDKWPIGRTISFAVGISLLDYSNFFFSVSHDCSHVIKHDCPDFHCLKCANNSSAPFASNRQNKTRTRYTGMVD